jgi:hypothetical protein
LEVLVELNKIFILRFLSLRLKNLIVCINKMLAVKHLKDILSDNQIVVNMENNEEIISKLKFIGHIQKNERFNSKYFIVQQSDSWLTRISRTIFYPDNRTNALMCIRHVIFRSFEIIDQLLHKKNYIECKQVIVDMLKARHGMLNLKYTYKDDTKFCCDMDVLIQKILFNLKKLEDDYDFLFDEINKEDEEMDKKEKIKTQLE